METSKIIDIVVMSKYCHTCAKRGEVSEDHQCQAGYESTSGGMEVSGVINIVKRSEKAKGVKYTKYLGDGDSKAFKAVLDLKP